MCTVLLVHNVTLVSHALENIWVNWKSTCICTQEWTENTHASWVKHSWVKSSLICCLRFFVSSCLDTIFTVERQVWWPCDLILLCNAHLSELNIRIEIMDLQVVRINSWVLWIWSQVASLSGLMSGLNWLATIRVNSQMIRIDSQVVRIYLWANEMLHTKYYHICTHNLWLSLCAWGICWHLLLNFYDLASCDHAISNPSFNWHFQSAGS